MRWSQLVREIIGLYKNLSLEDKEEYIRKVLARYKAKDIHITGNRVSFVIPHIPLRYIKRGNSIEKIKEDPNRGLFNVNFVVAYTNQWIIVDVLPEYGEHPNWFPDKKWLCTGNIKLAHSSLDKLIDHVISSLEMGTERVDGFQVEQNLSPLAKMLLGDDNER